MGLKVEDADDALRGLCLRCGWTYAVLWQVDAAVDPGLLTVRATYAEERFQENVDDVLCQVQRIGEGIIGSTVLHGKHRWLFADTSSPQDGDLWEHQFVAGIKTIAIIPQPALAVVMFGSAQKILESMDFINQVNSELQMPEILSESFSYVDAQNAAIDVSCDPCEAFASVISSVDMSKYNMANFKVTHNNSGIDMVPHMRCQTTSMEPSCLKANTPLQCHFPDKLHFPQKSGQDSSLGDQVVISSSSQFQQDALQNTSNSPFSSITSSQQSTSSRNELFTRMEHQLMKMIEMQQFPKTSQITGPVRSHDDSSVISFQTFSASLDATTNGEPRKACLCGEDKLTEASRPLPMHAVICSNQFNNKKVSESASSVVEPLQESASFLTLPEDLLALEYATSTNSQSDTFSDSVRLNFSKNQNYDVEQVPANVDNSGKNSSSFGFDGNGDFGSNPARQLSDAPVESTVIFPSNSRSSRCNAEDNYTPLYSDSELFDGMELDLKNTSQGHRCWDDIIMMEESVNCPSLNSGILDCIPEFGVGSVRGHGKDIFSDFGLEHIVEAVSVGNIDFTANYPASELNPIVTYNAENQYSLRMNASNVPSCSNQVASSGLPQLNGSTPMSFSNLGKHVQGSSNDAHLKSQVSSWISDCYSINAESSVTKQPRKSEGQVKVVKKRARQGESTRPRPKDRQLIQDRVKELREIVPNSTKCSIDALLDRTIKHMLYLQNLTKYAEKLKPADEPKMIGDESGVVLRENSSGGGWGATWAFEVAGQTMVCPIIVEDLSPPGQMLIEMLCEEHGFFLEIAEIIRGFGLTILKGVMEVRDSKIWAHFLVEANRTVTRMEIFLSLVQLLQQTNNKASACHIETRGMGVSTAFNSYKQSPVPIPISLGGNLH